MSFPTPLEKQGVVKFTGEILALTARKATRSIKTAVRDILFRFRVIQTSSHNQPSPNQTDLVVCCLVRDGRPFLNEFLKHYRQLGVHSFIFLDNGSTDETVEFLSEHQDVSVYQTFAPYKHYKNIMKKWLVTRFGKNNWVLCVDIDEFFDYPASDKVPLPAFLQYLNDHDYNCVVAQMLDMFPIGQLSHNNDPDWRTSHCYYSLADLDRLNYAHFYGRRNSTSSSDIEVIFGGARMSTFGVRALLTKHPLQYPARGCRLVNSHHVSGGKVADISAVLLHYKFAGDFAAYAEKISTEESFSMHSREYKKYVEVLRENPDLALRDRDSEIYYSPTQLVDAGFIVSGEGFRSFVDMYARLNRI